MLIKDKVKRIYTDDIHAFYGIDRDKPVAEQLAGIKNIYGEPTSEDDFDEDRRSLLRKLKRVLIPFELQSPDGGISVDYLVGGLDAKQSAYINYLERPCNTYSDDFSHAMGLFDILMPFAYANENRMTGEEYDRIYAKYKDDLAYFKEFKHDIYILDGELIDERTSADGKTLKIIARFWNEKLTRRQCDNCINKDLEKKMTEKDWKHYTIPAGKPFEKYFGTDCISFLANN